MSEIEASPEIKFSEASQGGQGISLAPVVGSQVRNPFPSLVATPAAPVASETPFILNEIYEPLDKEIASVVTLLRKHEVDTFSSCDGGDGHDFEYPIIRLYPSSGRDMREEELFISSVLSESGYCGYYIKYIFSYQSSSSRWHGAGKDFMEIEFWETPEKLDFEIEDGDFPSSVVEEKK